VLWEADSLNPAAKEMLEQAISNLPPSGALVIISEETNTKKNNFLKSTFDDL